MTAALATAPDGGAADAGASAGKPSDPLALRGLPSPLLLGSASFTRKLVLSEMNVPFVKLVRPIDERSLGDRSRDAPSDLVLLLASAKMDKLVEEVRIGNCADELPPSAGGDEGSEGGEWILLTGDQVVVHDDAILEKPTSIAEAREFVRGYASSPCRTVGSCVLAHLPTGIRVSGVDTASIHFRPTVDGDLVDRLLEDDAPALSCAGGLMIEHQLAGKETIPLPLPLHFHFYLLPTSGKILPTASDFHPHLEIPPSLNSGRGRIPIAGSGSWEYEVLLGRSVPESDRFPFWASRRSEIGDRRSRYCTMSSSRRSLQL
ncbi:hypothetical protein ACHAWF_008855 [Thalassiosira exigua]